MAVRTILHYPDKRLRIPGKPVTDFGPDFQRLIEDMAETMYAAPGVGLAAPQIGVSLLLFVTDTAMDEEGPSDFRVFANPEILETSGQVTWEEGCLSFPGVREELKRAEWVRVRAQGIDGKPFELSTDGLLAIAIQHENDHIHGRLMIDQLGPLRRKIVHRAMMKRAGAGQVAV